MTDRYVLTPAGQIAPASNALDRPIPTDYTAEQATLVSLLDDPTRIVAVAPVLGPPDFFFDNHRAVYQVMMNLHRAGRPADLVTIGGELARAGLLESLRDPVAMDAPAGQGWLLWLFSKRWEIIPWHVEHYAGQVKEAALGRALIALAGQIGALGYQTAIPVVDRLSKARALLSALTPTGGGAGGGEWVALGDLLAAYYDALETRDGGLSGLSTGIPDLDAATDGLQKGDLIVVLAPTSGGKSALGLAFCLATARAGIPTGVLSLEMSRDQYCQRVLAHESGLDSTVLRTGRLTDGERQELLDAIGRAAPWPLYLDARKNQTVDDLCDAAYRLHAEHGCQLLLVDYAQLISRRGMRADRDDLALGMIAARLKALAGELDCPVIVPSQMTDDRTKDSRAIGEAADLTIQIKADLDPYKVRPGVLVPTELVISKQRNGGKGVINVLWDQSANRFLPPDTRHVEY